MNGLTVALLGVYVLVSTLLFVYGAKCYLLAGLRVRSRRRRPPVQNGREAPLVTVQLPIFNERYVLPRLLKSIAELDWPRHKLEIQILDDSTDDTGDLAARLAREWRADGLNVQHVTRSTRRAYKAGALGYGLKRAKGDFVAIFDADFLPRRDFLRQTIPHFHDEKVGCVQTRWAHVNEDYSWLTRAQSVSIDGHFGIEQRAKNDRGYPINFNGTAGVWRRTTIDESGGWSGDTLAEDLDLSYRAQLGGWRFVYLDDVTSPAEIPVQMQAYKRQQFRWAKGGIQCARRHLGAVLRSRRLSFGAKFFSFLHLTHHVVHPLMILLLLLFLPLMLVTRVPHELTALFAVATFGPPVMYGLGQRVRHPKDWYRRVGRVFTLALLGIGVAINNSRAVLEGLFQNGGTFRRTPKFDIERAGDSWRNKRYVLGADWTLVAEFLFAGYAAATFVVALQTAHYLIVPWTVLFFFGFAFTFVASVTHRFQMAFTSRLDAPVPT